MAIFRQHVHIVQPAQPVGVLDGAGNLLDGQSIPVQHVIFFVTRLVVDDLLVQNRDPGFVQGFFQSPDAFQETQMDQGGGLYWPGDVLGKEQQGFVEMVQQFPLGSGTAVPRQKHIRHFHRRACQTDHNIFHLVYGSFLFLPRVRISSMNARA